MGKPTNQSVSRNEFTDESNIAIESSAGDAIRKMLSNFLNIRIPIASTAATQSANAFDAGQERRRNRSFIPDSVTVATREQFIVRYSLFIRLVKLE